ncbi:hypothetical protein [Pectobacterium brasiliense]|uniref:hypothetical protein n=1 Tax=Pectobacterium brasiliense TaxID=180957 RepID=UPI002A805EFA|nr:hypothetical protein [Pectobacterium brasiliense]MDY4384726.1 hypothetical protein [Pectobacterium brasiliense]
MTNEQAVSEAQKELQKLKKDYMDVIKPIVINKMENGIKPNLVQVLDCHIVGNKYFNYLEDFVGQSDLLGAHISGLWITSFSETCLGVLKSYIEHMEFINSYSDLLKGNDIKPDISSFANIQRIVKNYLKKEEWKPVYDDFERLKLPVKGFISKAHKDKQNATEKQQAASILIGVVVLTLVATFSVFVPSPTPWQQVVLRAFLSIGISAIAVPIPGFITVKAKINGAGNFFSVLSGGAIAIFILIWFFTPKIV